MVRYPDEPDAIADVGKRIENPVCKVFLDYILLIAFGIIAAVGDELQLVLFMKESVFRFRFLEIDAQGRERADFRLAPEVAPGTNTDVEVNDAAVRFVIRERSSQVPVIRPLAEQSL